MFNIGDEVVVTPESDDIFADEFTGVVSGFRGDYVQVTDGDDNVFEVWERQLRSVE